MSAFVKRSDCSGMVCVRMYSTRAYTDQYTKRTSIVYACITMPHLIIDVVNLTRLQILILGAFVMISSGVVLYLYSLVITLLRLGLTRQITGQEAILNATYTMFAGMFLEDLFLVSLKIS